MKKFLVAAALLVVGFLPVFCCTSTITIAAIAPSSDTICAGASIQYNATIQANGGTGSTYQWKVNGLNAPGATAASYLFSPSAGDVVTCVLDNTCGNAVSNSLYPVVKPVLNEKGAQFFCGGYTTTPISLFGASWTNNNTGIGLAASGSGDIPAFLATNNSNIPVTATITAVQTCATNDTTIFPIIINPVSTVSPVSNQTICTGSVSTAINFGGPVTNTVFSWTGSNSSIGLANSGQDSLPSFNGINNGNTPIVDTITVTPATSGYAYMTDAINGYAYAVSRATNNLIASISGIGGFFNFSVGITVSSDGNWVYIANNGENTVSVISTATNTLANTINVGSEPWGIVISPDGKHVYVTNTGDGTVSVIQTSTGTVSSTITLPDGPASNPEGIAISPDGSRLYVTETVTGSGMVYFIETATSVVFDSASVGSNPTGIIVSPDGAHVYVANYSDLTISTISVSSKAVTTSAVFTTNPGPQMENNGLALSPDGLTLYVSSFWDGTIAYYNTSTNPPVLEGSITLPGGSQEAPVGLSVSADGLFLYASNCGDGPAPNYSTLEVINTATKTVVSSDTIVNPDGEEVSYSFGNFVNGINCTGTPFKFTITVNPASGVPSVGLAITSGSQTTCTGSPVTFTATPVNVSPSNYDFRVNGISVQNGSSATYTTDTIDHADIITCIMSGNTCTSTSTDTSNSIIMTVGSAGAVSVNITANPTGAICAGANVTFAAAPVNGGANPVYQWLVNGHNAATNRDTFSISSLSNNDTVTCILTSTLPCVTGSPATSNLINVAVTTVHAGTISAQMDSVCQGDSAVVNVIANSIPIQWQSSSTTGNFADIPGAVGDSYAVAVAQTTYFRVYGSSGGCTDTSGVFSVTTKPVPAPPSLTAADSIICAGDSTRVCVANSFVAYLWNTGDNTYCTEAKQAGGYWVNVTAQNGCSVVSQHKDIAAYPTQSISITVQGDTLASFGGSAYQWYLGGQPISNATGSVYVAQEAGSYTLQVTDTNGCTTTSSAVSITGIHDPVPDRLLLYPNPSAGSWHLMVDNKLVGSKFDVYDTEGRIILQSQITSVHSEIVLSLSPGFYWLRIFSGDETIIRKLLKI